jgi:hypothetical protein
MNEYTGAQTAQMPHCSCTDPSFTGAVPGQNAYTAQQPGFGSAVQAAQAAQGYPAYGTPSWQQSVSSAAQPAPQQSEPHFTDSMAAPINALNQPQPITTESLQYINGFLRTMIGKKVTVDFLIGTTSLVDKSGTLLGVGANYILINEIETDDLLVCDFYSIKFVRVYY